MGRVRWTSRLSDARIRSVEIFDSYRAATAAQQKPLYQWASQDVFAGGTDPGTNRGQRICVRRYHHAAASLYRACFHQPRPMQTRKDHFLSLVEHRWMQQAIDPTDPLGNTRGHDVPRAQGGEAGLQVYLSQGKLAANLNGTVITSTRSIPLDQWVGVDVAYDGSKMVLRINGSRSRRNERLPYAAEVMGPKFQWMATHPGDPEIPFDGIGPEGVMATRVLRSEGSRTRMGIRASRFLPAVMSS